MEVLSLMFVGEPQNIVSAAGIFLLGYLVLRFTSWGIGRNPRLLLAAAGAWMLYAAWEWLILIETPEANIRVDLLVVWPLLAIFSAWAMFRALR